MYKVCVMVVGEEEEMDVCIVMYGMFIDMLFKMLFDVLRMWGK